MRISTNFSLPLAAFLFAVVLMPSFGRASQIENCPTEPAQKVSLVSGETYYGTNCILSTTGDVDSFQFTAKVGDVWSTDAAMTTNSYPENICLALYAPGNTTAIFSGCTNSYDGSFAVGTNQTLTVAGAYTIIITETENGATDYGISLERLSPAPPDGVPLKLAKSVASEVNAPTAQNAFTFYGATTGTYEIAASMTAGGYPTNLCFAVYEPSGTSVASACTNSYDGAFSISRDVTPTATGTYVVVLYEAGDNTTVDYNVEVSCLLGTCPAKTPPAPACLLTDQATYSATTGALTMNFNVGTSVAATWNGWLTYGNTMELLWSVSRPITEPPVQITKTQALAASGKVGILSTLTTPTAGITCSSLELVGTGKP